MPVPKRHAPPKLGAMITNDRKNQVVLVQIAQRAARPGSRTKEVGRRTFRGGTEKQRLGDAKKWATRAMYQRKRSLRIQATPTTKVRNVG